MVWSAKAVKYATPQNETRNQGPNQRSALIISNNPDDTDDVWGQLSAYYEIIRQWYAKLYLTIVDTVQYGN